MRSVFLDSFVGRSWPGYVVKKAPTSAAKQDQDGSSLILGRGWLVVFRSTLAVVVCVN